MMGFILCAMLRVGAEVPETLDVTWDDLKVEVEFEDPFEALKPEQLMHLGIVARVRMLQDKTPDVLSNGMVEEMEEALAILAEQGVDVEGLFAMREEIKLKRTERAVATNPELDGKVIRMHGYALPLEIDASKGVTEFLLVPWVGACIHTPPPAPNQIVTAVATEAFEAKSRFEPVTIEGLIKTSKIEKNLYLVDGAANISVSYVMEAATVSLYKIEKEK